MDEYHEGTLSGRTIFWCPGGGGHIAYCPQPIDPDDWTYCCIFYWKGTDLPSCCRYPFHTGVMVAFFLSGIVIAFILAFFCCWCVPWCPLAKRIAENHDQELEIREFECQQQPLYPYNSDD
ncbi:hypothetical protein Ddc_18037 [Ditylenchus destructor]|nr:hypothetical protein Ddc_18037 [Ditylenchus destructor]